MKSIVLMFLLLSAQTFRLIIAQLKAHLKRKKKSHVNQAMLATLMIAHHKLIRGSAPKYLLQEEQRRRARRLYDSLKNKRKRAMTSWVPC